MSQSSTLSIRMDVHKESSAVAYVAHEYGAEVVSFGTLGLGSAISPSSSGSCSRRASSSSSSTKLAPAAPGSIGT
jgi:hypothetical protein